MVVMLVLGRVGEFAALRRGRLLCAIPQTPDQSRSGLGGTRTKPHLGTHLRCLSGRETSNWGIHAECRCTGRGGFDVIESGPASLPVSGIHRVARSARPIRCCRRQVDHVRSMLGIGRYEESQAIKATAHQGDHSPPWWAFVSTQVAEFVDHPGDDQTVLLGSGHNDCPDKL